MSKLNIQRTVENIRSNTTVYSPIVEVVINAIQAIEAKTSSGGKITVDVRRTGQTEMDGSLSDVQGFDVQDNGVGFTTENRESFDTLYSDLKKSEGGKGFGRFVCPILSRSLRKGGAPRKHPARDSFARRYCLSIFTTEKAKAPR